jgi:hypothetical protein
MLSTQAHALISIETPELRSAARLAEILSPIECDLFPAGGIAWRVQILDFDDIDLVAHKVREWLRLEEAESTTIVLEGGQTLPVSRYEVPSS